MSQEESFASFTNQGSTSNPSLSFHLTHLAPDCTIFMLNNVHCESSKEVEKNIKLDEEMKKPPAPFLFTFFALENRQN